MNTPTPQQLIEQAIKDSPKMQQYAQEIADKLNSGEIPLNGFPDYAQQSIREIMDRHGYEKINGKWEKVDGFTN